MKIVTDYDDGSNSDITTVLTTKSGYSELGKVAEKYLLEPFVFLKITLIVLLNLRSINAYL